MRPCHSTCDPAAVHADLKAILARTLGLTAYKRSVTADQLLDLLVIMATAVRTLFAVARARCPFSAETGRRAVRSALPSAAVLAERLADALHAVAGFGRLDRQRRWNVAIDTHLVAYYGDAKTHGVAGGPRKQGTNQFHTYATAVLIHKRRRFTVGLLAVEPKTKPHEIVRFLLEQIRQRGLTVGGVVLDAGFGGGDTVLLLQTLGVSYTVPLQRTGKKDRRSAWFDQPHGTIGTVEWTTKKGHKPVEARVLVWRRKEDRKTKVFAFAGWGAEAAVAECKRAWLGRRRYRERFGIETSYRQKNQARAWTTSRSLEYRLLLEGIAQVLRQVWVCRSGEAAKAKKLRPTEWVGDLPFVDLLEGLADLLRDQYPMRWPTGVDPRKPLENKA